MGETTDDEWENGAGEPPEDWPAETDDVVPDRSGTAPAFLLGALLGMLILGLVWITASVLQDDAPSEAIAPEPDVTANLSGAEPLREDEQAIVVIRKTRLDRCQVAAGRMAAPLQAADPAMGQWEVHVGAMNKLVVGAITLQQATDFWESTRLGALRKIGRFHDAGTTVRREGLNCPVRSRLGRASEALRSCVDRVTADEQTLRAARTAITRWEHHVHDMDRMRLGLLSPATVSKRWLVDWQKGVREIEEYKSAAKAAARSGEC
jgi:hypothetical protein